ncbi:MAG: hypothetical protein R3324_17830 [Halobacteriales archaeon]|nr:hypothetical protein [Halobacteriales archaeon]
MSLSANRLVRLLDASRRLTTRVVKDTPGYLEGIGLAVLVAVLVTVVPLSAVEGSGVTPDDALLTAGASVVAIATAIVHNG